MANTYTIAAKTGESAVREMLITALNTSDSTTPKWSAMGVKVAESTINYDWGQENKKDILGHAYTTAKTPEMTQSFSGSEIVGGDDVMNHLLNLAVVKKDHAALVNQDCLIIHTYLQDAAGKVFAERYQSCSAFITTNGGEGGGVLVSDIELAYGGIRTTGTATYTDGGTITFTPDKSSD